MADYSIALCAGEASGDLHGANLVNAMKKIHSPIDFWGCGGKRMRSAGVDLCVDLTSGGTIGVVSTIKTLPVMFSAYMKFKSALIKKHPDLFIPIDFGAFNTRIARRAVENGIDVVYYIPPSSWRKNPRNADTLISCGGKAITPFPWSAEKLKVQGVDARFYGHPLIDIVKPQSDKKDLLVEIGPDLSHGQLAAERVGIALKTPRERLAQRLE
ncbi:MAG: hypothetical protein SNJ70_05975, partial [Armatimonadota bacterium]